VPLRNGGSGVLTPRGICCWLNLRMEELFTVHFVERPNFISKIVQASTRVPSRTRWRFSLTDVCVLVQEPTRFTLTSLQLPGSLLESPFCWKSRRRTCTSIRSKWRNSDSVQSDSEPNPHRMIQRVQNPPHNRSNR